MCNYIYNLKNHCAKLYSEFLLPIIYRKLLNRLRVKLEVESQNWVKGYKWIGCRRLSIVK